MRASRLAVLVCLTLQLLQPAAATGQADSQASRRRLDSTVRTDDVHSSLLLSKPPSPLPQPSLPAVASAAQPARPRCQPVILPPPNWMRGPGFKGRWQWSSYSKQQAKRNRGVIAAANASGTAFSLALYGDSITQHIQREGIHLWDASFSPKKGWGPTALLGVPGNGVPDLMWRLAEGGELPAKGPKLIAVLIGINDLLKHGVPPQQTAARVAALLDWLRAARPCSRLVLLALLPNARVSTAAQNRLYARLAGARNLTFLSCAQRIDPRNTSLLYDGTHPALAGQRALIECLEPAARALLHL